MAVLTISWTLEIKAMIPLDPHDKLIAAQLGEDSWRSLPRHYRAPYTTFDCLQAFERVYSRIEPLSAGWYGQVFRLYDKQQRNGYILKAIPLQHKAPIPRMLTHLGGIEPMDEVKVGRILTERVSQPGYGDGFLETIDWFQCNHLALMETFASGKNFDQDDENNEEASSNGLVENDSFEMHLDSLRVDPNRPDTRLRKRYRHIDTQYIITREVPGPTVFDVIPSLFHRRPTTPEWLDRGIKFIRFVALSTIFELHLAHRLVDFGHFDLNLKNFKLTPDFSVDRCLSGDDGPIPGYFRYELFSAAHDEDSDLDTTVETESAPKTVYYVPKADSCGARLVIIDYGTSRAQLDSTDPQSILGPNTARAYTSPGSVVMNIRYALFSLISYIPRRFFRAWRAHDRASYDAFAQVFRYGGGFDRMERVRGAVSGYQRPWKQFRELYMYGLPNLIDTILDGGMKEQFWYARAAYKVGTYTTAFQNPQEPEV